MRKTAIAALLLFAPLAALASSFDDLNAGIQLRNQENWKDALGFFDRALAAGDLSANQKFAALLDRGDAHQHLNEPEQAIADYSAALALQPTAVYALWSRAEIYESQKKFDAAVVDLNTVIAARPLLASPIAARVRINLKRGDAAKSRDDLRQILSLMPEGVQGREIGILYWQLGLMAEADKNFSWSVDRGHDLYSWLWLSLVALHTGKEVPRRDVPDYEKEKWPGPVVGFFLGKAAQQEVFDQAAKGETEVVSAQVCEANFYVGEWLLQHHDDAGVALVRKAAKECPTEFVEWSSAQMEVAGLP